MYTAGKYGNTSFYKMANDIYEQDFRNNVKSNKQTAVTLSKELTNFFK